VALAVVVGWRTVDSGQPHAPGALTPTAIVDADADLPDADDDLNADDAWAVVRTVADDVNWGAGDADDAGIALRPGSANSAALALTPAELTELARLLEHELTRGKGA
jgi:hypothetical protein